MGAVSSSALPSRAFWRASGSNFGALFECRNEDALETKLGSLNLLSCFLLSKCDMALLFSVNVSLFDGGSAVNPLSIELLSLRNGVDGWLPIVNLNQDVLPFRPSAWGIYSMRSTVTTSSFMRLEISSVSQ